MCPYCRSRNLIDLGWMGNFHWFRCRDCGGEFYITGNEPEIDEDEEA